MWFRGAKQAPKFSIFLISSSKNLQNQGILPVTRSVNEDMIHSRALVTIRVKRLCCKRNTLFSEQLNAMTSTYDCKITYMEKKAHLCRRHESDWGRAKSEKRHRHTKTNRELNPHRWSETQNASMCCKTRQALNYSFVNHFNLTSWKMWRVWLFLLPCLPALSKRSSSGASKSLLLLENMIMGRVWCGGQ